MLKNISIRYDPTEDRMVVRLVVQSASEAAEEHWLHVTRRVCAAWRQDLQAMVDLSAQAPERLDAAVRASVSQAHHQAMASQAKARTEPVASQPASLVQPALVTHIVCGRRRSDGRWLMRFERRDLPSLSLVLSGQTLHALVDAVSRRIRTAAWGLAALPVEQPTTAPPAAGSALH